MWSSFMASEVYHHCKFEVPEIIFGRGLLRQVGSCARRLGGKNIFLVSDQGLFESGWVDFVMKSLTEAGLRFVYYDQVTPNPKDHEIEQGALEYISKNADVIVGLGGGSAMDAAKGIAILVSNGGHIRDYAGNDKIHRPLPPMVLCPTTCGTGSDVSQFAIINDTDERCKLTIMSRCVAPDISLTDPDTLSTLPDEHVGSTAVDALSHAVEAYFSVASSTLTDVNALRALNLLSRSFVAAVKERKPEDMENLSRASLHAGMAFSNSLLGVGHALAHPIGGLYDANHGNVNAVLLPEVLRFDFPVVKPKIQEMAVALGSRWSDDEAGAEETSLETVVNMLESGGAPSSLRSLGVQSDDLELIAQRAFKDICVLTSPRETDESDLLTLLKKAY
jgi:alcohol dehydrogenase